MELAIDTSSSIASLALAQEGTVLAELTWRCEQNHSRELLPSIDFLTRIGQAKGKNLTGIIVAIGPGSFNGLRVGVATAKGLAYALNIPLVGISTLEAEALPHLETGFPVCPIQAAGREEVAVALFQQKNGQRYRLWEEQITTVANLVERITEKTLFCGGISPEQVLTLKDKLGDKALIASGVASLRRAGFLAELGWARLQKRDWDDMATLQPLYLRRPPITTPKPSEVNLKPPRPSR